MKKLTLLCLSLLSAQALLADMKIMMDVCVGPDMMMCMKGELVLTDENPVAELSNAEANITVQVQQVPAEQADEATEAAEFEVTIIDNGVTSKHMVHGPMGCSMQCSNAMVMVTMMAQQ